MRDLDDEYLFGRDLLVAPVLQAGQTSRQVYLPEGDWYDWHSGERFSGRSFIQVPTPMEQIPVFARGGAVVPLWPEAPDSTDGYHPTSSSCTCSSRRWTACTGPSCRRTTA